MSPSVADEWAHSAVQGRTGDGPDFGRSESEPDPDSGRQRAASPMRALIGRGVDHGGVVLQRAFMEISPRATRTSEPRGMIANACMEWVLIKESLTVQECLEENRHGAGALAREMSLSYPEFPLELGGTSRAFSLLSLG